MTLAEYEVRTLDFTTFRHMPGFGPRTTAPGRVLWTVSDYVQVLADGMEYRCKVTGKTKRGEAGFPVVGDLVEFEPVNLGESVITAVLPRASKFSRRAAGGRGTWREQVLAANIDQVIIVFAVAEPEPHLRGLDRFLVVAEENEMEALVIANKVDLIGLDGARALFGVYERVGYPIWYTSAREGQGLTGLLDAIAGKVSLVAGPSGVGKSSLLNAIVPGLDLRTGAISQAMNKGRHTTVVGTLLDLPGPENGFIADTPGLREIGPWDVAPEDLDYCYREFRPFLGGCRYADCLHRTEAGCAIRPAVEAGEIDAARYDSYLRLLADLEGG
ncbi:MAG: ribosome small subunit-dependent GTPase A [Dehalococcoidia bacterium]